MYNLLSSAQNFTKKTIFSLILQRNLLTKLTQVWKIYEKFRDWS